MTLSGSPATAAYLFADDYRVPFTYGRPPQVSDAELVALAGLVATGTQLGSAVPRPGPQGVPGLVPPSARSVPIQPAAARSR